MLSHLQIASICTLDFLLCTVQHLSFVFQEVLRRFPDGIPLLDPIEDMGIKDHDLKKLVEVRQDV